MPVYDYRCKECEHHFTDIFKVDERATPTTLPCPSCQKSDCIYIALSCVPHMDIMKTTVGTAKHKPSQDFREVMKRVKKNNRGSTVKDY